jgi:hypothetical protein
MANPFEDPDVKSAAASSGNNTSAYDDHGTRGPPPAPSYQQQMQVQVENAAMNAGKTMVTSEVNKMNEDRRDAEKFTTNHNERPPPPLWIERCFAWLPIRTLALIGGICFVSLPWIDLILLSGGDLTFSGFFILIYIIIFGFIICCIESPTWRLTRRIQLGIYFWARFCSRMWGRATFYVFISIMSFALLEDFVAVTGLIGIYVIIIAFLMYIVSWTAAKKYVRIFVYIAGGTEGDQLKERFSLKFDELDMDKDGKIGSEAIVKIALEAGRTLTNAERHALQSFLDESCNGAVTKDDWMRQFLNNNMKIKFL